MLAESAAIAVIELAHRQHGMNSRTTLGESVRRPLETQFQLIEVCHR